LFFTNNLFWRRFLAAPQELFFALGHLQKLVEKDVDWLRTFYCCLFRINLYLLFLLFELSWMTCIYLVFGNVKLEKLQSLFFLLSQSGIEKKSTCGCLFQPTQQQKSKTTLEL
jgi:hypothetical protein